MADEAIEAKEPEAPADDAVTETIAAPEVALAPDHEEVKVAEPEEGKVAVPEPEPEAKAEESQPETKTEETATIELVEEVPTETPEEKAKREREALDASTSYIDSIDTSVISLKDEDHPQLQRPGVKPSARRGRTKQAKTFAELEEDERKRQEEAAKPHDVDQTFSDNYGLLDALKKTQRGVSVAQEAQNVHASFMQKAKERREKEEAERKAKEALLIQEEAAQRASTGGRPKSVGGRPKSIGRAPAAKTGAAEADKVEVDIEAAASDYGAELGFVEKLKQGCCIIS